ncbi:MAG: transketolase [Thermoplasmata archaeon]|nr:MAG: transketolase [Thermoplasmata archaeon]MCD6468446.1 transketolase [Thermoplasmata archaeon]RLF27451.1 MAG: transketolase [Thermoplasmata archaeon]
MQNHAHDKELIKKLNLKAVRVRKQIIEMLYHAKSGHPGGSLSATDAIVALYFHHMRHNPKNPGDPDRDRFILSKGHAAPALYAVLAESGYFSKKELLTLRQVGSILQGHPANTRTPGVEVSTGSLGQGLSFGIGVALAGKLDKKNYNVYVLIGDGESEEGQVWEAAASASHHKLDNLTALLDRNMLQIDGCTEDIVGLESTKERWAAFGWNIIEIDGHDIKQILDALHEADSYKGKPTMIIMRTVKGRGVSFMENNVDFHGVAPNEEEYKQAMKELDETEKKLMED